MVDVNLLCDELSTTSLCTDSSDALDDVVKCYNSISSLVSVTSESREIERGNLSIQSLNPVSGHIISH